MDSKIHVGCINIDNKVHQQLWFANVFFKLKLCYSKRKRGYEDDGHVAKEPRLAEAVRKYFHISFVAF